MNVVRHFTAVLLSIFILGSTTSFSIYKHFCLSSLQDISLILPSDGCGMEVMSQKSESGCELEKAPCCTDIQELVKGQEIVKLDLHQDFDLKVMALEPGFFNFVPKDFLSLEGIPQKKPDDPPSRHDQPLFILFEHFVV